MAVPADQRHSHLARQVGTLAVAQVSAANAMARVRAARWHNVLIALGEALPWVVIHDLGLLLTGEGTLSRVDLETLLNDLDGAGQTTSVSVAVYERYRELLKAVAESELAQAISRERVSDEVVAVVLSRVLGPALYSWSGGRSWAGTEPLPLDPAIYSDSQFALHYRDFGGEPVHSLIQWLAERELFVLTSVEQLDLDTVKLLGLLDHGASSGAGYDLADLINVLASPEANGVVNFAMDLLPSVLETQRATAAQTFSVDGYAGLARRGSVDSLLLSELAYDDDLFEQKLADQQLYYFSHERQHVDEQKRYMVLVDGSASMRGDREVFARGLTLTLCKKLALQGGEVSFRFFDSRLYQRVPFTREQAAACRLLCFRSERGRNYGRVFRQLAAELRRHPDEQMVIYLITHGQCHVERRVMEDLTDLAHVYGVFILPSIDLHINYLELLYGYRTVGRETLQTRSKAVDEALGIVEMADAEAGVSLG